MSWIDKILSSDAARASPGCAQRLIEEAQEGVLPGRDGDLASSRPPDGTSSERDE